MATNDEPTIQPDTVEALVDHLRELLRVEEGREQTFTSRGAAAAGYAGLIATVSAAAAARVFAPDLPEPWKWVAVLLLAGVVGALLSAAITVLFKVLMPRESTGFGIHEVKRYPTRAAMCRTRMDTQARILRGLADLLISNRSRLGGKAVHLRRAYIALGAGMVMFAALVTILGLHAENVV